MFSTSLTTTNVAIQSSRMDSKTSTNNLTSNNHDIKQRAVDSESLIFLKDEIPTNNKKTKKLSELDCKTVDDVADGTSNTKVKEEVGEAKENTDKKQKRAVLPQAKNKQEFTEQTRKIIEEYLNFTGSGWNDIK